MGKLILYAGMVVSFTNLTLTVTAFHHPKQKDQNNIKPNLSPIRCVMFPILIFLGKEKKLK